VQGGSTAWRGANWILRPSPIWAARAARRVGAEVVGEAEPGVAPPPAHRWHPPREQQARVWGAPSAQQWGSWRTRSRRIAPRLGRPNAAQAPGWTGATSVHQNTSPVKRGSPPIPRWCEAQRLRCAGARGRLFTPRSKWQTRLDLARAPSSTYSSPLHSSAHAPGPAFTAIARHHANRAQYAAVPHGRTFLALSTWSTFRTECGYSSSAGE